MQELGKFNLKINVIPNELEEYVSFPINNKLRLLGNLVKNFGKDDFKYLSQEFDNNILDLVKQKEFYPYEYICDFEKFKEELPSKEKSCSSLTHRKIIDKEYEHVLMVLLERM